MKCPNLDKINAPSASVRNWSSQQHNQAPWTRQGSPAPRMKPTTVSNQVKPKQIQATNLCKKQERRQHSHHTSDKNYPRNESFNTMSTNPSMRPRYLP